MEIPLISVIIPVYNVENYLSRCLHSVLSQSLENIEIIVINDCSPDDSQKIIDQFSQKDTRIKGIHNQKNMGLGPSRNIGMQYAKGEYIFFFDSDDYIEKDSLNKLYQTAKANSLDILVARYQKVYENKTVVYPQKFKLLSDKVYTGKEYLSQNLDLTVIACNKLFKRSFLLHNQFKFPSRRYEDVCFSLKAFQLAKRVQNINLVFYNHCIRENSIMTSKVSLSSVEDIYKLYSDLKQMYIETNQDKQVGRFFFWSIYFFYKNVKNIDFPDKMQWKRKVKESYYHYRSNFFWNNKLNYGQRFFALFSISLYLWILKLKQTYLT